MIWTQVLHMFLLLVAMAQQSSQTPRNGSSPACIYSCFATAGYPGRKTQDISVWEDIPVQRLIVKSLDERLNAILFWWGYTLLAFLTFFTTETKGMAS